MSASIVSISIWESMRNTIGRLGLAYKFKNEEGMMYFIEVYDGKEMIYCAVDLDNLHTWIDGYATAKAQEKDNGPTKR